MKIEILGFEYALSKHNVKFYTKFMKDLIHSLDKPFVVSFSGFPRIHLMNDYYEYRIHGIEKFLLSLSTEKGDFHAKVDAIADEDKVWTKQRNQDNRYWICRKYTLKKELQEEAKKKFMQILNILESSASMVEIDDSYYVPESQKQLFYIGKVHAHQILGQNESKREVVLDADVVNINGQVHRFISRDIQGIGVYCYPARLKGSHDIFDRTLWTQEEQEASLWLHEFCPLSSLQYS